MAKTRKKTTKNKPKTRKKSVKKKTNKVSRLKSSKKRMVKTKNLLPVEYKFEKFIRKEKKKLSHRPYLAALLNFFLWGTGFMYIGRFIYGVLWLFVGAFLMMPSIRMWQFLPPRIALYFSIGYLLISTLLAVDAYFDAIEIEGWND